MKLLAIHQKISNRIENEKAPVKIIFSLTLIYPAHFEDVPCQSGVNHIFEG